MMTKIIVSMVNPINCKGFLPQVSMTKNEAQYPGIKPPTAKTMFPTETLCKFW